MLQMEDIAERDDDQAVSALEYEGLDDDDGRLREQTFVRALRTCVQLLRAR
jgi:hypothetical protein